MSFARYPAYKDSGVEWLGEVPAHWILTPIKRMGWLKGGAGFPHEAQGFQGEELEFHKVNSLSRANIAGLLQPGENTISRDTAQRLAAYVFPPNTIVFAKVGAALLLGRIRELSSPACIDNNMMGLVIQQTGYDVGFIRFAMKLIQFDLIANPGAVPSLNEAQIGNFALPMPPRNEQEIIRKFLVSETAKIDALVTEQETLMALLKEKRQAVISHAVTKGLDATAPMKDSGVIWLGEVPAHWAVQRVKHLVTLFEQGWSPQCENFPVETPNEWGVLKVGCVNGGKFKAEENKALPSDIEPVPSLSIALGDLLISRANTRELVGSAAIAKQDYPNLMLCDKLFRLRFDESACSSFFVACHLGTVAVRGQIELAATGASSSMVNIGQSTILELEIALPPMAEQESIVRYINQQAVRFDELAAEAQTAITLLQERRTALISAAVTGQIDVRHLVTTRALEAATA